MHYIWLFTVTFLIYNTYKKLTIMLFFYLKYQRTGTWELRLREKLIICINIIQH